MNDGAVSALPGSGTQVQWGGAKSQNVTDIQQFLSSFDDFL
jgi:hypothetical protein